MSQEIKIKDSQGVELIPGDKVKIIDHSNPFMIDNIATIIWSADRNVYAWTLEPYVSGVANRFGMNSLLKFHKI